MKKKAKRKHIENIKQRKQLTLDNMIYSLHRLDLLIISISGAGTYVCLEAAKFIIEKEKPIVFTIQFSALLFVISIVSNLISQYTGYLSNRFDYRMCEKKINSKDVKEELTKAEINRLDKKSQFFDDITTWLNISSLALLIFGLITLLVFFFNITF